MAFTIGEITAFGRDLLAKSTATNKIIYTHAIAESVTRTPEEIRTANTIPAASGVRVQGSVLSSSATGNVARISTQFTNQAATRYARTIWLYGRLENQSSANVVAAIVSDANIYIPAHTLAETKIVIDFNIAINNGNATMNITETSAATVGQLADLQAKTFGLGSITDRTLIKEYENFIEAQCYARDGDDFCVKKHRPFYRIKFQIPEGLEFQYTEIVDICDHWLVILVHTDSLKLIWAFDLREATIEENESVLSIGTPSYWGITRTGQSNKISLLKIDQDYFVCCLSDDINTIWTTSSQESDDTAYKGSCAIMPLQNSHDGQIDYSAGQFYSPGEHKYLIGRGKYAMINVNFKLYFGVLQVSTTGNNGIFCIDETALMLLNSEMLVWSGLAYIYPYSAPAHSLQIFVANELNDGAHAMICLTSNHQGTEQQKVWGAIFGGTDKQIVCTDAGYSESTKLRYNLSSQEQVWWNGWTTPNDLIFTTSRNGVNMGGRNGNLEVIEVGLHSYDNSVLQSKPYIIPTLDIIDNDHVFALADQQVKFGVPQEIIGQYFSRNENQVPNKDYVCGNSFICSGKTEQAKYHFIFRLREILGRKTNGRI